MEFYVTDIKELQKFKKTYTLFLPNSDRINLDLSEINKSDNSDYQDQLNQLLNYCGCTSGAVMACLLSISYIYYFIQIKSLGDFYLSQFVLLMTIFFAGGLLGKIIGLLFKTWRIHNLINRITIEIALSNGNVEMIGEIK